MKEKEKKSKLIPDGFKCYQKVGGGSHRFPNRIIKPGQKFWCNPSALPKAIVDVFKEVPADYNAVIVNVENVPLSFNVDEAVIVPDKFEVVQARDDDGEPLKKGKDLLFNVVDEEGKVINDKPLRKSKAEELVAALNV
jgi:hypothetical protein